MTKFKVLQEFAISGLPMFEVGSIRFSDEQTARELAGRGIVEILAEAKEEKKPDLESKKDSKTK